MRDYIIINGVNSLSIKGLAITKLPSIYKPIMRTEIEEIDGRNGDIITELGYGAYNKELTIGLFGDYDIDEIIAFFNQKGTIIFSNENDKVYIFDIVDQIEFEKLIKFRSATINIHCQPFKYPLSETPIEVEYEYVTGEGENITLDDTDISALELDLKGNTSQTGTPTPTTPIPVNVVSGDNDIVVCGKNLFNVYPSTSVVNSIGVSIVRNEDGTITLNGTANSSYNGFVEILYAFQNGTAEQNNINLRLNSSYTYSASLTKLTGTTSNDDVRLICQYDTLGNQATIYMGSSQTITNSSGLYRAYIRIVSGTVFNNLKLGVQLEKGSSATNYEPYQGNTYNIDLPVENLWNISNATYTSNGITANANNGVITLNGTATANTFINVMLASNVSWKSGEKYSISAFNEVANSNVRIRTISTGTNDMNLTNINQSLTITYDGNTNVYNDRIVLRVENGTTLTNFIIKPQLEVGTKANSYTPYGTTPIELCKIGNYQDYIYKDSDKWYLHKEIGKAIIDDNESSLYRTGTNTTNIYRWRVVLDNTLPATSISTIVPLYCDKLTNISAGNTYGKQQGLAIDVNNDYAFFYIDETNTYTLNDMKTWLASNPLKVYYILATPTNTEITYQPLIDQLNAIEQAQSKENQTNISQINNDLPFIISASALKKSSDTASIVNDGNIYSKPLIDIEGTGLVTIYLDNTQMFQVDLSELNNITIDTELLEAYSDTQLANRKVVGDYSKFKLQVGTNQLKFGGALTKATITRYKRWL